MTIPIKTDNIASQMKYYSTFPHQKQSKSVLRPGFSARGLPALSGGRRPPALDEWGWEGVERLRLRRNMRNLQDPFYPIIPVYRVQAAFDMAFEVVA